jgi:guanine nucleotide-binding protein G(i) subunit alpha
MKIMYKGDLSEAVLATYRPIVYHNLLISAQELITYMRESGLKWEECSNEVCRPIISN